MTELQAETGNIDALRLNFALAALIWTGMIAALLAWSYVHESDRIVELARKEALTALKKDQAFRYWGTRHGGVYVPATEKTPPNPHLENIAERDIATPSGKKLTLMNPAYMVRQIMEDYSELYNIRGRITSLNLLNPKNAPDDWERRTLESFENGVEEVFEIVPSAKGDHIRLMRPLITGKGCLKCHGRQGCKTGDVRGGVSTTAPMAGYYRLKRIAVGRMAATYTVIWLLGLISAGFIFRQGKMRLIVVEGLRGS